MSDILHIIWGGLLGTPISQFFALVIVVFFIGSLVILFKQNKFSFITEYSPSILISLGLFSTFFGIALGLANFDVQNIEESIPELLSGVKLAFWTSVLAMFCALLINFFKFIIGAFFNEADSEESISASDIYQVMVEQRDVFSDAVSQIREFRTDLRFESDVRNELLKENFRIIVGEFRDFATKMADNNSKALIEALKEVIHDFNAKINEQFGENFKELNQAVCTAPSCQDRNEKRIR